MIWFKRLHAICFVFELETSLQIYLYCSQNHCRECAANPIDSVLGLLVIHICNNSNTSDCLRPFFLYFRRQNCTTRKYRKIIRLTVFRLSGCCWLHLIFLSVLVLLLFIALNLFWVWYYGHALRNECSFLLFRSLTRKQK